MGDQKFQTARENLCTTKDSNGLFPTTPFIRRPPIVNKVDGRARILRPLRHTLMQSNQQPTTSTNNANSGGRGTPSGGMPHSQSMPVLQSGNRPSASSQQPSGRALLTLPSNTTERNALPLNQWIEGMRKNVTRMRLRSRKALEIAMRENATDEDLSKVRDSLTEISNIFYDMTRAATLKCRFNAVYDKRIVYKNIESSIHDWRPKDVSSSVLLDKFQEAVDDKIAIEKNVFALSETFRQHAVDPPRISRLFAPPPVTFSKHVEDASKGVYLAMEVVLAKIKGEAMSWKFKRISHPCFRNSKCLIMASYCARRPSSEKDPVTCMKAMIVLKYGVLEDLVIGGEDEDLYDQERLLHSKRTVYREFTKSAKEIILCSSVTKFTSPTNIAQCNNYIQSYVNCFSTKCYYCKKHLRQFMPPTVVTREASPIICHRLCLMSQVP